MADIILSSAQENRIIEIRQNMAEVTAKAFVDTAKEIESMDSCTIGLKNLQIEQENLIKEIKAICLIMKIASDLCQSANLLFKIDKAYSASSLIRQLVEIEYLAWAFDNDSTQAQKWIDSNKEERRNYFTPAKLRRAAQGNFRSKDYGYHCELGGHPVPDSDILLDNENNISQILLSDMLGHTWRIWDHLVKWAVSKYHDHPILKKSLMLVDKYDNWHKQDILSHLPSPP